jgi:hypothetical protein
MLPSNAKALEVGERRAAERHACKRQLICQVIDLVDESVATSGTWNLSTGGVCVIVEPHYAPGTHVEVAFHAPADGTSVHRFAEVIHSLLVPSLREMWLTGCSFCDGPVSEEELRPYL